MPSLRWLLVRSRTCPIACSADHRIDAISGERVLLETNSPGDPGAGPFYGDPQVQAAIRVTVAEMGKLKKDLR